MKIIPHCFISFLLAGCLLMNTAALGQRKVGKSSQKQHDAAYFNTPEDWYKKVEGKPFPLKERYTAADGRTLDFAQLNHPTIVCFGFAACPPCRHELPVYVAAAKANPQVDFVYITYDDEATRQKELTSLGLDTALRQNNYYVLHMTLQEIDRHNLTLAYPTQYFLKKDGTVTYMQSGGDPDEPVAEVRARIEQLIANEGRGSAH